METRSKGVKNKKPHRVPLADCPNGYTVKSDATNYKNASSSSSKDPFESLLHSPLKVPVKFKPLSYWGKKVAELEKKEIRKEKGLYDFSSPESLLPSNRKKKVKKPKPKPRKKNENSNKEWTVTAVASSSLALPLSKNGVMSNLLKSYSGKRSDKREGEERVRNEAALIKERILLNKAEKMGTSFTFDKPPIFGLSSTPDAKKTHLNFVKPSYFDFNSPINAADISVKHSQEVMSLDSPTAGLPFVSETNVEESVSGKPDFSGFTSVEANESCSNTLRKKIFGSPSPDADKLSGVSERIRGSAEERYVTIRRHYRGRSIKPITPVKSPVEEVHAGGICEVEQTELFEQDSSSTESNSRKRTLAPSADLINEVSKKRKSKRRQWSEREEQNITVQRHSRQSLDEEPCSPGNSTLQAGKAEFSCIVSNRRKRKNGVEQDVISHYFSSFKMSPQHESTSAVLELSTGEPSLPMDDPNALEDSSTVGFGSEETNKGSNLDNDSLLNKTGRGVASPSEKSKESYSSYDLCDNSSSPEEVGHKSVENFPEEDRGKFLLDGIYNKKSFSEEDNLEKSEIVFNSSREGEENHCLDHHHRNEANTSEKDLTYEKTERVSSFSRDDKDSLDGLRKNTGASTSPSVIYSEENVENSLRYSSAGEVIIGRTSEDDSPFQKSLKKIEKISGDGKKDLRHGKIIIPSTSEEDSPFKKPQQEENATNEEEENDVLFDLPIAAMDLSVLPGGKKHHRARILLKQLKAEDIHLDDANVLETTRQRGLGYGAFVESVLGKQPDLEKSLLGRPQHRLQLSQCLGKRTTRRSSLVNTRRLTGILSKTLSRRSLKRDHVSV